MTDRDINTGSTNPSGTVAVVVARVVVPLWLFLGAVLKLADLSPTHLPAALIQWCGALGMDLNFVLRFSIAAELVVVGVMVLLPPLARWTGIIVLGSFIPILVGDLVLGASSCGCFGAIQVNPWITLVMDVTFFVLLLICGRREPRLALGATIPTSRVVVAGIWSLLSVALAFGLPSPASPSPEQSEGSESIVSGAGSLPSDGYYLPDYESWIGRPFADLEVAAWSRGLPSDLTAGQQYVILYRKDCEHCHELLALYFSESLEWPTTAIAVPERSGWPTENIQPFPCAECRLAELPAGIDWFFATPVLIRLGDGIVECAAEVDPTAPECLVW